MAITFNQESKIFHLYTESTSYQILLYQDAFPLHLYWGKRVYDDDYSEYLEAPYQRQNILLGTPKDEPMFSREYLPFEYPSYGTSDFRPPAFQTEDIFGDRICDAEYVSHEIIKGKPKLDGLPSTYCEDDSEAETLIITLKDEILKLEIKLYYSVLEKYNIIARHTEFINLGEDKINLNSALSMSVDMKTPPKEMLHLCGSAIRETHIDRRPMGNGDTGFENSRGMSSHQENPFVALLNPETTETFGEVYAVSLAYSGNFKINANIDMNGSLRLQAGLNPFEFNWTLKNGDKFVTPEAIMVYSDKGLGEMSRTYHKVFRERLSRGNFKFKRRPVLLNTWEASYFSFTHDSVMELAKVAKDVGAELLVLDDGWFGHRDNDKSSLGDWYDDLKKLPKGIKGLCQDINSLGIEMGLWFEPEMVSPDSDLYRAHPDWCIHVDGRKRTQWRTQLVLDLSREDVCDYIVDSLTEVLSNSNITYVKWDCNRRITEASSALLPADRKGELFHRYVLGLYDVLERLMSRFPDILWENCASGGARFDPGMMYYFSQNWTSDNTDAITRLKIQHGASMVYPPIWMTSHISASPNHQMDRPSPLKFREMVCQPFNLGYELNLLEMSEEELNEVAVQIKNYKEMAEDTQFGDFFRLQSPFEGESTAWMIRSADEKNIYAWFYRPYASPNEAFLNVKLAGLEEQGKYKLLETGKIFSGSALMNMGLNINWKNGDHLNQFWHFEKI